MSLNIQNFDYNTENSTGVEDQKLLEPYTYLNQLPGHRSRDILMKAFKMCLEIPEDKLLLCHKLLDTFYLTGTLWDDMEDFSVLRRGCPTAHLIYGVRGVFNGAHYAALLQLSKIRNFGNPKLSEMTVKYMVTTFRGQSKDLHWRDNFICPSVEEYRLMTYQKQSLLVLGAKLLQSCSENKPDLTKFTKILASFVQIRNDYVNLSDECAAEKSFCEDISEGKFSLPVIHAIQTRPDDRRVIDILKQKSKDLETKEFCLSLLKKFGSVDYTYEILMEMKEEMVKELERLPSSKTLVHLLDVGLKLEKF